MRYAVCSLFYPTAIVIATVSLDQSDGSILYGRHERQMCWMESRNSLIVSLVVPQIIVCVATIIGLLITVMRIRSIKESTKWAISKGAQRNGVDIGRVAVKMALLLGIAEIIGFVRIANPKSEDDDAFNSAFSLLYAFLRSSRGIFLWMVHVLWSIKCKKKTQKRKPKYIDARTPPYSWHSHSHSHSLRSTPSLRSTHTYETNV